MKDKYDRKIDYLRISITDKCNLNCIYCNGYNGKKIDFKEDILSVEEIYIIAKCMANLGVRKIRLTGGEPLVRKDIVSIIKRLSGIEGIEDVSLTTNGILLEDMATKLKEAGLTRINVSLDSLKEGKTAKICGLDIGKKVIKGIKKAILVGLNPVKINTVLIKGLNDDEIEDFINFSNELDVQVRFIELMPMSGFGENNKDKIIYSKDILAKIVNLKPMNNHFENGPSKHYKIDGQKGRVGFISPLSDNFCENCNRIRVTSDGKIRLCLGNNQEIDIRKYLKGDMKKFEDTLEKIIYNKPKGHDFRAEFSSKRKMGRLGG